MAARQEKLKLALIVGAVVLAACTPGWLCGDANALETQQLQLQDGARQQSARVARRIVSLVPALTEILFAVGAGPQVIGVSSYDDFPPQVKSLPQLGALLDPDIERIFSLKPDLVIVYGSQTDLTERLGSAGIRVFSYRHAGITNVIETIRNLAALSGHPDNGTRVTQQLQKQLDDVRTRVRGRPKPRTMIVMGRDTLALRGVFVSAGMGFLHELLEIAGGDDVFADVEREGLQPSNETMIVRAPQVIVELHAGDAPPASALQKERAVWSQLASIPAVRNGRVYFLYGDYLVTPGPRLGQAAEALARVLHPDAFR